MSGLLCEVKTGFVDCKLKAWNDKAMKEERVSENEGFDFSRPQSTAVDGSRLKSQRSTEFD